MQLRSHRYHVQYPLSSCPLLMCFRNSVYQYWGGRHRKGGVSNPGCAYICSWGLYDTRACVKGRPSWGKTFPASTSDPLAPVNPSHSPFPLLAWLHYSNPWRSGLRRTGSACQRTNGLKDLCNCGAQRPLRF